MSKARRSRTGSHPKPHQGNERGQPSLTAKVGKDVGGDMLTAGGDIIQQGVPTSVVEAILNAQQERDAEIKRLSERVEKLEQQGRNQSGEHEAERRLKAAEQEAAALRSEAVQTLAELADEYYGSKRWEEAIRITDQLLKHLPDLPVLFNNRGIARGNLGDPAGELADYGEAIRLKPDFAETYYNRGIVRVMQGDHAGAVADYTEAIRLKPDLAEAYYNRGWVLDEQGDYTGAVADYTEAIRLKPDFPEAYHNRGVVGLRQGDYIGAIADYTDAIRLKPDFAEAYLNRGVAWVGQGVHAEAVTDFTEAIRLKPGFAETYYSRGLARDEQGDYAGSVADYTEAIRLRPDYADAYHNLSIAARLGGQDEVALMALKGLAKHEPSNADYQMGLAAVYQKMGDEKQYRKRLAAARKLAAEASPYSRARLESVAGNIEEALAALAETAKADGFDHAWAAVDPDLETVRADDRFWGIVKRE